MRTPIVAPTVGDACALAIERDAPQGRHHDQSSGSMQYRSRAARRCACHRCASEQRSAEATALPRTRICRHQPPHFSSATEAFSYPRWEVALMTGTKPTVTSNERCPHGISLTAYPACHFCTSDTVRLALSHLLSHVDRQRREVVWCDSAIEEACAALDKANAHQLSPSGPSTSNTLLERASLAGAGRHSHETLSVEPFPYPTDRDGWICSMCHGWNQTWTRVCLHSHLPIEPTSSKASEHEQHMCTSDCTAQKANERPKCSGTMGCHVHWSGWPTHHPDCSDHRSNRSESENV